MLKQLCLIAIFSPFRVGVLFLWPWLYQLFHHGYRYIHGFSTPDKELRKSIMLQDVLFLVVIISIVHQMASGCTRHRRSVYGFFNAMECFRSLAFWVVVLFYNFFVQRYELIRDHEQKTVPIRIDSQPLSLKLGADCSVILFFSSLSNYQV